VLQSWQVVDSNLQIAETAARLRATLRLQLPDAVQAASAVAITPMLWSRTIAIFRGSHRFA
jgi:phage tail protein X